MLLHAFPGVALIPSGHAFGVTVCHPLIFKAVALAPNGAYTFAGEFFGVGVSPTFLLL
jgi:hypothetical protein